MYLLSGGTNAWAILLDCHDPMQAAANDLAVQTNCLKNGFWERFHDRTQSTDLA